MGVGFGSRSFSNLSHPKTKIGKQNNFAFGVLETVRNFTPTPTNMGCIFFIYDKVTLYPTLSHTPISHMQILMLSVYREYNSKNFSRLGYSQMSTCQCSWEGIEKCLCKWFCLQRLLSPRPCASMPRLSSLCVIRQIASRGRGISFPWFIRWELCKCDLHNKESKRFGEYR